VTAVGGLISQARSLGEIAQSTGILLLAVLAIWSLLALLMYWAHTSGAASFSEEVKYRMVKDDEPIPGP